MAATIPVPLKAADIARFALRAGQLEKAKPVVAYYCYYWIIDQIISKGLHQTDKECMTYTTDLMDKLEQMKVDYAENNAITDDVAGHAYVEQFGQETFQRAENTMNANKVTRQTADTYQAAATFLDLNQIWGTLDPEITSKIKFAKYHALRIAKALKAGEDPNLSNPVPEPDPEDGEPLDPNDPEVQAITGTTNEQDTPLQPSVEEVPDEHDRIQPHLAQLSTLDESLHPSRAPSVPPQPEPHRPLSPPDQSEDYYSNVAAPDVSPLDPTSADRKTSSGGGYFPTVSDGAGHTPNFLPDAPPQDPGSPPVQNLPESSSLPPPSSTAPRGTSLHSFPPPPPDMGDTPGFAPPPSAQSAPFPQSQAPQLPAQPRQPTARAPAFAPAMQPDPPPLAPVRQPAPRPVVTAAASSQGDYQADEVAIAKAQKHARWAISALNFEDVKTAVQELRGALETLGAA